VSPGRRTEAERLEELEDVLDLLRQRSDGATVVVEGARDLRALEQLGVAGTHVALHRGKPLHAVMEELAAAAPPVILLLDWDRTGGRLHAALRDNLAARIEVDTDLRRRLAMCCHARSVEEVPPELEALRRSVGSHAHR
jgi:5S rRNA maturation endonuclease (ribonuclease M5)